MMRLFLDSCVIIYWIEAKESYYEKFLIKLAEINNKYPNTQLVVSRLSMMECFVLPLRENHQHSYKLYKDFFAQPSLEVVELNSEVIEIATNLRVNYRKLKTPDAIQAACALVLDGDVCFITNDKVFESITDLNVINM